MSIRKATVIRTIAATLIIVALGALGMVITYKVADAQKRDYFEQRKVQATTAAAVIDYKDVQALTGSSADLSSKAYANIRAELVRIKQSDPRIRFVYLMRPQGRKMVFLVDAEDPSSTDYSPPGQVYDEAKPSDFKPFTGGIKPPTTIDGPVTDRWGTWLSASAYINNNAGKAVALLGTDVEIAHALDSYNQVRRLGTIFDILAVALMGLVAAQWIVWRNNKDKRDALSREVEASAVRLNRELIKADRMKSDFIQLASHELRSPVNAVNVALQTLERSTTDRLTEDEKTLVNVASNGSSRLVDLVDNLLDMTRIDAGDYVLRPIVYSADELVSKTVQLFVPLARNKKIVLTEKLPNGPVDAVVDPQAVLRILENLVANAIKFTDFGGVVVELKPPSDKLVFTIQDTGAGIPDDFKDEVFARFSKLDRPTSGGKPGAGMGLALAKSLVDAQGGRIWFESTEGKGTTFFFEVPRYQDKKTGVT
jgi:signal transduction histidine kinase